MCKRSISIINSVFLKKRFASGHIPTQWKQANVVPVHKKGNKSQVSNYRPISLLCIVSKVMERYIYNSVYNIVEPIINTHQHMINTHAPTYDRQIVYHTTAIRL